MTELTALYRGGWVRYRSDDMPLDVFAHVADQGGRLVIVDLVLLALDESIDTTNIRAVPLGRIEAWVNSPDISEEVRARIDTPVGDIRVAIDNLQAMKPEDVQFAKRRASQPSARPSLRLPKPAKGRYRGDDFYRAVAAAYSSAAARSRGPAGLVADANRVEVSKVHRWVKKARELGFLAPGQRGKAT